MRRARAYQNGRGDCTWPDRKKNVQGRVFALMRMIQLEPGGWKTEDGRWKTEAGSRKLPAIQGLRSACAGSRPAARRAGTTSAAIAARHTTTALTARIRGSAAATWNK